MDQIYFTIWELRKLQIAFDLQPYLKIFFRLANVFGGFFSTDKNYQRLLDLYNELLQLWLRQHTSLYFGAADAKKLII